VENGVKKYYDIETKTYKAIPGRDAFIILDNLRETNTVWERLGAGAGRERLCLSQTLHLRRPALWSFLMKKTVFGFLPLQSQFCQ